MIVGKGLLEHGVLQRAKDGTCDVWFGGTAETNAVVHATVKRDGEIITGFDEITVGEVTNGELRGRLMGVPTGGPYEITLKIKGTDEQTTIGDLLVGDLWVLAGQSNMEGCGARWDALDPHPMVRAYYMDDHWADAKDPVNELAAAKARVHWPDDNGPRPVQPTRGTGLGVAFGQERFAKTGVPIGLIACAHGGTSMRQWSPALKDLGEKSLYGASVLRVERNGGKVAGILWYQGESDCNPTDASPVYTERMMDLIGAFRSDFADRTLPVGIVQLATHRSSDSSDFGWNEIRRQQYDLPGEIPHLAVVAAIDLPLVDAIHVSGPGVHRLGRRMAHAIAALVDGDGPGPIRASVVSFEKNAVHDGTDIHVRFSNLVGDLQAPWQPLGFVLTSEDGRKFYPYQVEVKGDTAILQTGQSRADLQDMKLYYGFGPNAYCNLTDSDDRGVPAFGPVLLAE